MTLFHMFGWFHNSSHPDSHCLITVSFDFVRACVALFLFVLLWYVRYNFSKLIQSDITRVVSKNNKKRTSFFASTGRRYCTFSSAYETSNLPLNSDSVNSNSNPLWQTNMNDSINKVFKKNVTLHPEGSKTLCIFFCTMYFLCLCQVRHSATLLH